MIPLPNLSTRAPGKMNSLGVLSLHLDGSPCRVGCEFCYLGSRPDSQGAPLDLDRVEPLADAVHRAVAPEAGTFSA